MTVYKYPLPLGDVVEVEMPAGAQILTVQTQHGQPCIWAMVTPDAPPVVRRFRVAGTGHDLGEVGAYLGTFQLLEGAFIGHVFEMP